MSYLSYFPNIEYEHPEFANETLILKDLRMTIVLTEKIPNRFLQTYILNDGERPEDVAYELYDDPQQYWILMSLNDVVDPFFDWMLPEQTVVDLAKKYYDDINAIHHYEDTDGEYNSDGNIPVTNIDHEIALNEMKREITVLNPPYLQQAIATLETELRKAYNVIE